MQPTSADAINTKGDAPAGEGADERKKSMLAGWNRMSLFGVTEWVSYCCQLVNWSES